jgi:hypothetical protein
MTSTLKTTITLPKTNLLGDATADIVDIIEPLEAAEDQLEVVREMLSVSAADTHMKHLNDAIGVAGSISKAITNPAADEVLTLSLIAKLESLVAALTVAGTVPAAGLDSTGATSGYVATANGSGGVSWAAAGGGGAQPVDITITAGETLAERDIVYYDSGLAGWYKADVDADPIKLSALRGVVNEAGGIASAATGTIRMVGEVTGFAGLTAWADVYAGATAGAYTQTKPTITAGGAQVAVVRIGVAISTSAVLVNTMPFANPCQFMKRASLADNGTLTLKHYADSLARLRRYRANLSGSAAGAALTSYASGNQDSDVHLKSAGATESSGAQSGANTAIGNVGGTTYRAAQSFTCTAGKLTAFNYTLGANVGSPTGTMTWEIRANNAGAPGTLLQTGTHATPTASSANSVTVSNGIYLAGSTTYWLVLISTSAQSSGAYWQWTAATVGSYANGQRAFSSNAGSSWTADAYDHTFSVTTSPTTALAQSFQLGSSTTIGAVKLYLKKVGSPTGNLTAKIYSDSGGSPNALITDGTSDAVAASTLSTSYGLITFAFSAPPSLTATTTYWIVFETADSASGANYVVWGADASSPGYTDGEMKSQVSAAWVTESKDAIFEVTATATTFDTPVSVCSWDADSAEVEITAGDGASTPGNLDTQSTLKNRKNATADIVFIVELD